MSSSQDDQANLPREVTIKEENYILRTLDSEKEIESWSHFCASCFATKKPTPPPPSHFSSHYYLDPDRDHNLILVLLANGNVDDDNEMGDKNVIVSTVRIFKRVISPGNLSAGGIGEVCTSPEYRRRGLIKVLMDEADRIMRCEERMDVSLLHASPVFFPVYEKFGYECVTSHWSVVELNYKKLLMAVISDGFCVRPVRASDFEVLKSIHERQSEGVYAGCVVRSLEYWKEYIGNGGMDVFVLEVYGAVRGWISLRNRPNGRYQLRDFAVDCDIPTITGGDGVAVHVSTMNGILALLSGVLKKEKIEQLEQENDKVELHLPTIILERVKNDEQNDAIFYWESVKEENDLGWMYKNLSGKEKTDMTNITATMPHLIWPADSF
mmetsp:Transcript_33670/g.41261  ORF Transcript_33670/g.41261 Transcript_33670/m.41261 type:complete len:381 (-) Transcript_33670:10-1152(-)